MQRGRRGTDRVRLAVGRQEVGEAVGQVALAHACAVAANRLIWCGR